MTTQTRSKEKKIEEWIKGFLMEIKIIGRDELNNFELQDIDEERAIELIKSLLIAERTSLLGEIEKIIDDMEEQQKWGGCEDEDGSLEAGIIDFEDVRKTLSGLQPKRV